MTQLESIIEKRHLSGSGEAMSICDVCEQEMDGSAFYLIAKAYDQGKLVLETLQCFSCQLQMQSKISDQSSENLQLYAGRAMNEFFTNPHAKQFYYLNDPACVITAEKIMQRDAFELYTVHAPGGGEEDYFFVGPTAMEQMSDLLSKETRESWERFIEQLDPNIPETVMSPFFVH